MLSVARGVVVMAERWRAISLVDFIAELKSVACAEAGVVGALAVIACAAGAAEGVEVWHLNAESNGVCLGW